MKIPSVYLVAATALFLASPDVGTAAESAGVAYVARLKPVNAGVAKSCTRGEVRFMVHDDVLTVRVDVHGVPPGMVHWQHFHGFKNGNVAGCPIRADDTNHDGIIDLIETEKTSGVTMVPLDSQPASMDVPHGAYPKADANGNYHYEATVSLKALEASFGKTFPGQKLDLEKRVVYIHGVPPNTKLPSSVSRRMPVSVVHNSWRSKGDIDMTTSAFPASHLQLKRAYESASAADGVRILIDRLWPRGVSKEKAALDEWMKDVAPSTELRKWFGHDPARWAEFQRRYRAELRQHSEELDRIRALAKKQTVTLVYSAHDEEHNDAVVLKEVLLEEGKG